MNLCRIVGIILAVACLQSVLAADTMWLCREDAAELIYSHMYLADTFPDNRDSFNMVDTGDALEGKYVNFDYQFGTTAPLHPGYAGFKFYWDNGVASFWVDQYDSMVFWHKGPLPGHKVMMIWAQGSAGCGTPINYEYFGQFMPSSVWKRESFPFPKKRMGYGAYPDSPFVKKGLFELRMLIYNDSAGGNTSPTSAKGDLKIDNMYFMKFAHAPVFQTQPQSQTVDEGKSVTFTSFAWGDANGAPTFQWKKNGNPITDATLLTYTIAPVADSDAGSYTIVATNSLGSVTSDAATLTINTQAGKKGCGCGSGVGLAIIPPVFFKAMAYRKRKKKNPQN